MRNEVNFSNNSAGSAVRRRAPVTWVAIGVSLLALTACQDRAEDGEAANSKKASDGPVYQTYGVHNSPEISPCQARDCVYTRSQGQPVDPIYPEYWVSDWTMYRVFGANWQKFPPPYQGHPPAGLVPGNDYEVSYGTSYYDSTWTGPTGKGAMMEYYKKRCLPIFPMSNNYTCSFISLGDAAFFITYKEDRPAGMPPVCAFSKFNHPPRRDFIKHLTYAKGDSEAIGAGGQGYSFWIKAAGGKVTQAGVRPVPAYNSNDPQILFGYGFQAKNGTQMPQSFYFSGVAQLDGMGPNQFFAPFVSQNYTSFTVKKPDPAQTWDHVSKLDINKLPQCQLFDPPQGVKFYEGKKTSPTWADIGRWNEGGAR